MILNFFIEPHFLRPAHRKFDVLFRLFTSNEVFKVAILLATIFHACVMRMKVNHKKKQQRVNSVEEKVISNNSLVICRVHQLCTYCETL